MTVAIVPPPLDLSAFSLSNRWTSPSLSPPGLHGPLASPGAFDTRKAGWPRPAVACPDLERREEDERAMQKKEREAPSFTSWFSSPFPSPVPSPPFTSRNSTVSLHLPSPPPSSTFNPSQHSLALSSPPRVPTTGKSRRGTSPLPISFQHAPVFATPVSAPTYHLPPAHQIHPRYPPADLRRKSEGDVLLFHPFYEKQHKTDLIPFRSYVVPAAEEGEMERVVEQRMEVNLPVIVERKKTKRARLERRELSIPVIQAPPSVPVAEVEEEVRVKMEEDMDEVMTMKNEREEEGQDDDSLVLYFHRTRGVFLNLLDASSSSSTELHSLVPVRFGPGQFVRCTAGEGGELFPGSPSDRNTWLRTQLLARFPLRPHQSGFALGRCVCDFVFVKHETLRARSRSEGDYEEPQREEGAMRRGENVREVWKRPSVCRNHLAKCKLIHPNDPLKQFCTLLVDFEESPSAKALKVRPSDLDSPSV